MNRIFKIYVCLVCFQLLLFPLLAQEKYTISGYTKEEETGEYLIGANVYVKELLKGTSTNQYGFFSLTLNKGTYTLVVSYLGFQDVSKELILDKDIRYNVSLKSIVITTQEVVIVGERNDKNTNEAEMGKVEMEMEKVKTLPAFMGEVDVLKTIQLLPGVQSAGEGNSGFYVRGGGPDQNLILLDEATVYNAAHLFGFFSVFNSDAIKNIELTKGGMPANYGGRLSSVLDISMKEGNNRKYQAEGGIGLIASRFTVQGPIKKDTSSFIVSGRRTYFDVLTSPFIPDSSDFKGSGYYFYDLNTKINYRLSDKDRLFLSGYFGRDVFTYKNKKNGFNVNIPWGNATTSLRWNHLFSDKLFMNATAIFSDYQFEFGMTQSEIELKMFSGIRDWNFKTDFNYFPSIRQNIKVGYNYTYHTFTPSSVSARSGDVEFDTGDITKQYAHEGAVYVNDEYDITDELKINAGLRYSLFQQVGPFTRYIKDNKNITTETIDYKKGESVAFYHGLEPRTTLRYSVNPTSSFKASFTQNYQYIHLASMTTISMPTDIWVPSSDKVNPQVGNQYAIGYFRNFLKDKYETSFELYYKTMNNQIEYKDGYYPEDNIDNNTDNSFTFGKGWSYGAELFAKKSIGKITGWAGYTFSWTWREFPEVNEGKVFPAKYDRRHDLSAIASYQLNNKWAFSATFVYATGDAMTIPDSRYFIEWQIVPLYGERNAYRLPSYHRLDVAATIKGKETKKFQSSWSFAIFNLYNRANPYFIYFDSEGDYKKGDLKLTAKQVSLFRILPSVTWNFKF